MGMRFVFVALATTAALGAVGCATVEQQSSIDRPTNIQSFASVGDVVLRVNITEDLPNAFGRADVYGRTRDRGFSELRYVGLSPTGNPVFRRRDVDIQTNETTMNTGGLGTATVTTQPYGSGATSTGVYTLPPAPNVQALPPDTIQFELNLAEGRIITMRDHLIEVVSANAAGVQFIVR